MACKLQTGTIFFVSHRSLSTFYMTVESTDIAQAYRDLEKAEVQAQALERMLDLLESKMDAILAEALPASALIDLESDRVVPVKDDGDEEPKE